jgi:hypothetical protein
MGLAVNTDICPEFGHVHIMWKICVMLPCWEMWRIWLSEAHEDTIFSANFVQKTSTFFTLKWVWLLMHDKCL